MRDGSCPVIFDVEPGMSYYVIGYWHHDASQPAASQDWFQLERVEATRAEKAIKKCRVVK